MRVLLFIPADVKRVADALALRGHQVGQPSLDASLANLSASELASADLVIIDTEVAERTDVIAKLANEAPGTEFILIGSRRAAAHPDVIDQLDRPIDLDRLLAVVDDLADVLDGERLREPTDVVAYETVFAGDSPQIRELLRRVRMVARSEAPVWIFGEDGSGRAIIARAIHDRSSHRRQPFIAFNTIAYSDDELSRILFQGPDAAMASTRGGTLFLERIGAAGPNTQRQLVQFLDTEDRDASRPRLVVGVHRDHADEGPMQFVSRELYHRLKVLEVGIPTLKERARDLEQIVGRMLERLSRNGHVPAVADKTMDLLARYHFPGNLLELAHALTHAYVLARGGAILPEHLPLSIRTVARDPHDAAATDGELEALDVVAKRFERDYLLRVLRSVGGNRGRASEILGLTRKGLWGKLKAHGISDDDIDREEAH